MERLKAWTHGHPAESAGLVLLAYLGYFTLPSLLSRQAFGNSVSGATVQGMTSTLWPEIWLVLSICLVLTLMGAWGKIGLRRPDAPSWKRPVFFAYLLTALLLALAVFLLNGAQGFALGWRLVVTIFATTFLVGFFEEVLFRGVVMQGLSARFGAVTGLLVTSVLFGAMHLVNWVNGQTLDATVVQCVHAGAAGFLYGALALRTGSLWPSILLHGLWDGTITLFSAVAGDPANAAAPDQGTGDLLFQLLFFGYEPVVAAIILAVWGIQHRKGLQPADA